MVMMRKKTHKKVQHVLKESLRLPAKDAMKQEEVRKESKEDDKNVLGF